MKAIILALFLLGSSLAASAQPQNAPTANPRLDPRIARLETVLNKMEQERQSAYQQFQMMQELRRYEIQEGDPLIWRGPSGMGGARNGSPINYDDNILAQRERRERIQRYNRELNSLYLRYSELGVRKRVLIDQLRELTGEPVQ